MSTCPQQITESFEVVGPITGTLFGGTYGAALSDGGTVLNYIDFLYYEDTSGAESMRYVRAEYPGPTPGVGSLPVLSRHELRPGAGGVFTSNLSADPDGYVYFWDHSASPPQLIKQNQDTFEVLRTGLPTIQLDGISWNPYDGMLYWVTPQSDGFLRRVDPDTGAETALAAGLLTVADECVCTPDGALWISKALPSSSGFNGFYRYDLTTDTLTSIDADDTPAGIPPSSSAVPAYDMPGGQLGSIAYRGQGGVPILMHPDFTSESTACAPFTGSASGTARVQSTIVGGRWITPFIWPTSGGFGHALWQTGTRGRWWSGVSGWT